MRLSQASHGRATAACGRNAPRSNAHATYGVREPPYKGRNPIPIVIPCHRVLAAGGKLGGFSAHGGAATKRKLLALEGVSFDNDPPRLPGL